MEGTLFGSESLLPNLSQEGYCTSIYEFCTEDNINQCLHYISQELFALGYPSIYTNTNSCPYAVNCDIVKFLNATYDLLQKHTQHIQIKEDLEIRNKTLSTDLHVLQRKLLQAKNSIEQSERKYSSALERERQLKDKYEQLLSQLKSEKDEVKKIVSSTQQQKLAYHHDIRKMENNMNQMKAKMSQLLADKNSDKKCANLSSSYMLQRNDGQRGKWKTGTVPNSRLEEMYNSVIAGYENRCKEMAREMNECCTYLKYVQNEISDLVSCLKECESQSESCPSEKLSNEHFYIMFKMMGKSLKDDLENNFKLLKIFIKEHTNDQSLRNKISNNEEELSSEVHIKENSSEFEIEKCTTSEEVLKNDGEDANSEAKILEQKLADLEKLKNEWKSEKEKIDDEKASIIEAVTILEKEKEAMEAQKLGLIQFELKNLQNRATCSPEQGVSFRSTSAVITSDNSSNINELKSCFSVLGSLPMKSVFPAWVQKEKHPENRWLSKSENSLPVKNIQIFEPSHTLSSKSDDTMMSQNEDLPKWAMGNCTIETGSVAAENPKECNMQELDEVASSASSMENSLVSNGVFTSDEPSLVKLKILAEDIERKRGKFPL